MLQKITNVLRLPPDMLQPAPVKVVLFFCLFHSYNLREQTSALKPHILFAGNAIQLILFSIAQ